MKQKNERPSKSHSELSEEERAELDLALCQEIQDHYTPGEPIEYTNVNGETRYKDPRIIDGTLDNIGQESFKELSEKYTGLVKSIANKIGASWNIGEKPAIDFDEDIWWREVIGNHG